MPRFALYVLGICAELPLHLSLFLTLIQLVYNVIYTSHLIHMQHPHISIPPLSPSLTHACVQRPLQAEYLVCCPA